MEKTEMGKRAETGWRMTGKKHYGHRNPSLRSSTQNPWKEAGGALDAVCQTWWRHVMVWAALLLGKWRIARNKGHTEQRRLLLHFATPYYITWTALDWSQFGPTTGQWPRTLLISSAGTLCNGWVSTVSRYWPCRAVVGAAWPYG